MLEPWIARLSPRVDGARALEDVRAIARHHRIQCSPGYDAAADWLAGAAREAGLDVEVEDVVADGRNAMLGCILPEGWACDHARARLVTGSGGETIADFETDPLSIVQRSVPASGSHPLVALRELPRDGEPWPVDLRGAVVVTEAAVREVHRLAVLERGAAGIVSFGRRLMPPARTREHDLDSLAYTSFWWAGDEPRGWGIVVSPRRGEALLARIGNGERLRIEVDIVTRRFPTRMRLVTACVPGGLEAEVLITGHLCHPRPGANDNGSGVAATLEAMRALAAAAEAGDLPASRRTLRALWMPELSGTYAWAGGDPRRADLTLAAINLDMVGEDQTACGSVQFLERAPHFAASFADELLREARHLAAGITHGDAPPAFAESGYLGGSDHSFWVDPAVGVPCPMLIQWPDRFYHSSYDSPDRCDPRSLAHASLSAAAYAAFLCGAGAREAEFLAQRLEHACVRDMRAALDAAEPARAARAARLRGQCALASLGRLAIGTPPASRLGPTIARAVTGATEAIDGVHETEIAPVVGTPPLPVPGRWAHRVPRRLQRSAVVLMRPLQQGWGSAPDDFRRRWDEMERAMPGGSTTLDLAWFACDGARDLAEIAERLADEGATVTQAQLETYLDLLAEIGACEWSAAEGH